MGQYLHISTKMFDLLTLTLRFDLLLKTFCLCHSFLTRKGFHITPVHFLWQDFSCRVMVCDLVSLTLKFKFDLLKKNFNLAHIFLTGRGRAFIFHMRIPCHKILHIYLVILTLQYDLLSKNIVLGNDFCTRRWLPPANYVVFLKTPVILMPISFRCVL